MKITKKIGFGALTLLATTTVPLVTVISCGGNTKEGSSQEDNIKKVEAKIKANTQELIQSLFWNAKIEKHPLSKKNDIVMPIDLNQNNEKITLQYGNGVYDSIYNKLKTDTHKNALNILDDPTKGERLIEVYKNNVDFLDKLGLAVRELTEDIMPSIFDSINSFKYELTYKKKDGTIIKKQIDITKEFKSRLEFMQYVIYGTKMNIRSATLDAIRRGIEQSLLTVDNSDRFDFSEIYDEIDNSYQTLDKSKAKDAWMKIIKVRTDNVQSHLGFAQLDIFKTKAKEENVDVTSMIKEIFNVKKDLENNTSMKKEAEYKFK